MKVLLLAGGMGTRLSEETVLKPKPMVEIGGRPIIWHITDPCFILWHNGTSAHSADKNKSKKTIFFII